MNKVAIIVVDMVYDFTNPNGKIFYPLNVDLLPKIHDFVEASREHGALIVYVAHTVTKEDLKKSSKMTRECCIEGSGGELIDERLHVIAGVDIIVKKPKYSAFFKTQLDNILKQHGVSTIVVVGTKTNNCIYATVLDAYNLNIKTYVPRELVGTNDTITNDTYLRDMGKYLCEVDTKDAILSRIKAGTL